MCLQQSVGRGDALVEICAPLALGGRHLYTAPISNDYRRCFDDVLDELRDRFTASVSLQEKAECDAAVYGTVLRKIEDATASEKSDTVFLFDWDDTVMATTYLGEVEESSGSSLLPTSILLRLRFTELDRVVLGVLKKAYSLGTLIIVTNAGEGWVQLSASRYLPLVSKFLQEQRVRVVSARSTYFAQFPEAPLEWKVHAFYDELRCFENGRLNLIVIGDSLSDQHAAHSVVERLSKDDSRSSILKFVKLIDRPTVDQLKRQMSLLLLNVERMVKHEAAFDICVAT